MNKLTNILLIVFILLLLVLIYLQYQTMNYTAFGIQQLLNDLSLCK